MRTLQIRNVYDTDTKNRVTTSINYLDLKSLTIRSIRMVCVCDWDITGGFECYYYSLRDSNASHFMWMPFIVLLLLFLSAKYCRETCGPRLLNNEAGDGSGV